MQRQEERKVAFFTQLFLDTPYMVPTSSPGRKEEGLPQPRTQASSRYPSYKRRLGTESEFS